MEAKNFLLNMLFLVFAAITWIVPNTTDTSYKITISILVALAAILVNFHAHFFYLIRKFWQECVLILLLIAFILFFYVNYVESILPALVIVITGISSGLLITSKYFNRKVHRSKTIQTMVPFTLSWTLNHWGGDCAKIEGDKMTFSGYNPAGSVTGSHIDLTDALTLGETYEIECLVKSESNTTAQFQLWCHNNSGTNPSTNTNSDFITPSKRGKLVNVPFVANFNRNIRIHLQYKPGAGKIEVSDLKIYRVIEE